MSGPYEDISYLPHPTSKKHPRMSMEERAAQFSPFAALTGFGGVIRETGRLTLTVQDTGRGMDAETLAHIGEPFYRPDKARSREQGGAGLGLALCFQIAQSHGAALSFTSAPGAGTTAAVIFTA